MDLVELPAAAAVRHGLCIKSEIGDCSFDRSIFVSTNPTKYTTRPASSGSRDGGFSPYGSGSAVDPKTGPRQFEKSPIRGPARREPGRRPRAYIQPFVLPRESNTVPLRASFFSESDLQEQNGPTPGAEEPGSTASGAA